MSKCSRCGCKINEEDLNLFTESDLNMLPEKMCLECLEKAYEDEESGMFFDTCEECGKVFDIFEEEVFYYSHIEGDDGIGYRNYDRILCGECALQERSEIMEDPEKYSGGFIN